MNVPQCKPAIMSPFSQQVHHDKNIPIVLHPFKGPSHPDRCLNTLRWLHHPLEHRNRTADLRIQSKLYKQIKVRLIHEMGLPQGTDKGNSPEGRHLQLVPAKVRFLQLLATKVQIIEEDLHNENNMDQQVEESKGEVHRPQPQESGT